MSLLVLCLFCYTLIGFVCYKLSLARKSTAKKITRNKRAKQKEESLWIDNQPFEKVQISSNEGLTLIGHFLKMQSDKLVIIVHGFGSNWKEMEDYAKMFYKRNFNLLIIECRAHGESEGDMVGMGWLDRLDLQNWIDFSINKLPNCKIVLFGVSMGASTVCMSLGEKMPQNVKCAIEDCGFDNVYKQICYVYHKKLKLTSHILIRIFYSWTKRARSFDLKQGDAIKQLKKSNLPMLFIHGQCDNFVPTEMGYNLFGALNSKNKEIYICEGAGHAQSFSTDPGRYQMKINKFLSQNGL